VRDEPIPLPLLQHQFIIDDAAIILHSIVTYMNPSMKEGQGRQYPPV
jgi:hypothetical protein